ncbi:MAG: LacI family DNA-binding transcriptional regulator [Actinomycetota bacterium]
MGITIYDVAAGAQVSPATVSRVLAGGGSVAPETAARVREVIERLGYRPDRVARSLRQQRSGSVGLLVPVEQHPVGQAIVASLSERLAEADLSLMVAATDRRPAGPELERLLAQRIDALFVVRDRVSQEVPNPDGVPVVVLDSGRSDLPVDTVRVDHAAGIRQAVRFMVNEGAQRLVYIGEGTESVMGADQLAGYAEATAERSVGHAALRLGPRSVPFARTEFDRLHNSDQPPDAYICGSDLVAATINAALPVEPSSDRPYIVGYGAHPWVALLRPVVSTIRLPVDELVDEAVRVMRQRLDGLRTEPLDIALPPSLILGETT